VKFNFFSDIENENVAIIELDPILKIEE